MGWSGIDSPQARSTDDLVSRTQRSASASAFTRVFDTLWAVHRRARTQNRENNPMQSKMGPGSQHSCCVAFGAREEKWSVVTARPNLIPLWISGQSAAACSAAEIGLADARVVGEDRRGSGQSNRPGFQHKSAAGDFQRHGRILLNQ